MKTPLDAIVRVCGYLGVNQKQLALAANIPPSRLSDIRHGVARGLSPANAKKLMEAFPGRFTLEELVFFKPTADPRRPRRKAA